MTLKHPEKKRLYIYKHWDSIRDQVLGGQKVEKELIVDAMSQCNGIDTEIEKYRMREYVKSRDKCLVDCDVSCGNEETDNTHQNLREQFQIKYGKDIKHG